MYVHICVVEDATACILKVVAVTYSLRSMTVAAEMREQRGGPRHSQSRKEGLPAPSRAGKFGEIMEGDALGCAGCALKTSTAIAWRLRMLHGEAF
jgi:hypothetical protein